MSLDLNHWIGSDAGIVRQVNEDGFLWLGPEQSSDDSFLWMVIDGVGGPGRGDLAAGLTVSAVTDGWPEAIAETQDPYEALDRVADEANRRVLAVAATYPSLRGMAASVAAVCYREGQLFVAHAGSARVYLHRGEHIQCITRDHVGVPQVAIGTGDDPDIGCLRRAIGHPDLRLDRGSGRPIPADELTVLLCTDGISRVVSDELLGHALSRLFARDATEALIELAKRNWSDDNATAGVIRFVPPDRTRVTTADDFLEWAASGMTGSPDRTLVLRSIGTADELDSPPTTNIESIPPIDAEPVRPSAGDGEDFASTRAFSPDAIASMLAGGGDTGTLAFSPQEMSAVRAAAGLPEPESISARGREGTPPPTRDVGAAAGTLDVEEPESDDGDETAADEAEQDDESRGSIAQTMALSTGYGSGSLLADAETADARATDDAVAAATDAFDAVDTSAAAADSEDATIENTAPMGTGELEAVEEPVRLSPDGTHLFSPQEMDDMRDLASREEAGAGDASPAAGEAEPSEEEASIPRTRDVPAADVPARVASDVQVLRRTANREDEVETAQMEHLHEPGDRRVLFAFAFAAVGAVLGAIAVWIVLLGD